MNVLRIYISTGGAESHKKQITFLFMLLQIFWTFNFVVYKEVQKNRFCIKARVTLGLFSSTLPGVLFRWCVNVVKRLCWYKIRDFYV